VRLLITEGVFPYLAALLSSGSHRELEQDVYISLPGTLARLATFTKLMASNPFSGSHSA
jgi:hypothetical protein